MHHIFAHKRLHRLSEHLRHGHGSDDTCARAVSESLVLEHSHIYIEPELKNEGLE